MATNRSMVHSYLSKEEKKAAEVLASLGNRSVSSLISSLIVKEAKERGILEETIDADGTHIQTLLFEVTKEERSEADDR